MSLTVQDEFKQVKRVWNPLSRERQRLASMFAVQRLSSPPLPPSSGRPAGSQHPKTLAQGGTSGPQTPSMFASGAPPSPCTFRSQLRRLRQACERVYGRDGL
jgi:hypothetical protein